VNLQLAGKLDFCGSFQRLAKNRRFYRKLIFVAGVLVVTPAAALEVWAAGLDPRGRDIEDGIQPRPGKTRFIFDNCGFHLFAFEHKGNKDAFAGTVLVAGKAGQSVAAVNQFFDFEWHESEL
jgi:F0F1-type ATP synthase assembly protein I